MEIPRIDRQSRKFQVTLQRPVENGWTEEKVQNVLSKLKPDYACGAMHIAPSTGSQHMHIFVARAGAIRFSTVERAFPRAHIEFCRGSCLENRDYIAREGNHEEAEGEETLIPGTFWEIGELPTEAGKKPSLMARLVADVEAGVPIGTLVRDEPKLALKIDSIERLQETLREEKYRELEREVEVVYLYGAPGSGKTRSIFDAHDASEICRVTNYGLNGRGVLFDAYKGQNVLVFEEFYSQVPMSEMLNILDRYPLMLPARYHDRVACYTHVYITSNVSLDHQYLAERRQNPRAWEALLRRISRVVEVLPDGTQVEHPKEAYM